MLDDRCSILDVRFRTEGRRKAAVKFGEIFVGFVFGPAAKVIHNSFEDPSLVTGTAEEVTAAYRKVRDEIRSLVETMPDSLPAIWSQQHLK